MMIASAPMPAHQSRAGGAASVTTATSDVAVGSPVSETGSIVDTASNESIATPVLCGTEAFEDARLTRLFFGVSTFSFFGFGIATYDLSAVVVPFSSTRVTVPPAFGSEKELSNREP